MNVRSGSVAVASSTTRLTLVNLGVGVLLVGWLAVAFWLSRSQLTLATMVDSVVDAGVAAALIWALRIADRPADADHPAGHQAAEPIAALVVAVLAGVLGIEVIRSAIDSLLGGDTPRFVSLATWVLAGKVAVKAAIASWCWHLKKRAGPAVRALFVDARNDVLTGLVAVVGYVLASFGETDWDAWLAIPIGMWIIASGFGLARDNMQLLMGVVANESRLDQLQLVVVDVHGVRSAHQLVARHHGTHLDVSVHVVVDSDLPLRDAHAIGQRVYEQLMNEPDVAAANVHLDVE